MKASNFLLLLILLCPCLPLRSQSVEPSTIEISFYGNENISNDELVENFKSCSRGVWKKYEERAYEYFAQKCSRELMFSRGFWQAKVVDITSIVREGVRGVQIVVNEGRRYRIGKIEIEGNKALSKTEILEMLGQRAGDVADGQALQKIVYEKLKERYGDLGYAQYNAEFEPDFVEPRGRRQDGVVNVTITIDEGRQFTLRRVEFVGVEADEAEALVKEFPIKPGDIFVPSKLEKWAEAIKNARRFAYVDKDRDVEIRTDEEAGDLDLVILLKRTEP